MCKHKMKFLILNIAPNFRPKAGLSEHFFNTGQGNLGPYLYPKSSDPRFFQDKRGE